MPFIWQAIEYADQICNKGISQRCFDAVYVNMYALYSAKFNGEKLWRMKHTQPNFDECEGHVFTKAK